MNFFIDTSNTKLVLILEHNNIIIDSLIMENQFKVSDIVFTEIEKFLQKNNLTLKNLKNLYTTRGPGSYTGIRVAITILKTLKLINPFYNIFLISSLAFQAELNDSISILDAKGNKSYIGIYSKGENIILDQLVPNELIEEFKQQFPNYQVKKDYENINFEQYFLKLKNYFKNIENIENIEPLYIKHFI
ncbi:tRNA (adenosine(37)-N6)-threonylcarbamoyltransferase complex dimerization subunit type 1 TsaB [Spiroplasma taiwanense]|uniref:Glycoprotease n=1 Tax=Spiroplasma taiwanense CT-1 TaxID=1276220 RepID=S5MAT2_9MOLU|nr:tRNA (adenosine(37)-N6)-threonylcarbamoyltransferase complex dimerization subunit type 1 TsaB [Spiroplasma taiwanense]AGR40873.1 glycoprotease [Spiroplasma taiwanense CT-1]